MTEPSQPVTMTADQYIAMAHFSCTCGARSRASEGHAAAKARYEEAREREPQDNEEINTKFADSTKAAMDLGVYEVFDQWAYCTCPGRPR